jgi:hypothetical protein
MVYNGIRRKVFVSHYKGDRQEVDQFIDRFANKEKVFIPYVLGANNNDDFIDSTNTVYVMNQIRKKYLQDTTVTIVLIGTCTHSRRFVDWELKSSLRQGEYTPNGVLGILLPSSKGSAHLPPRLKENWDREMECYACYRPYPANAQQLGSWIEEAYSFRNKKAYFIRNSKDMMKYNQKCLVCGVTH